jgi:hypothetical protein
VLLASCRAAPVKREERQVRRALMPLAVSGGETAVSVTESRLLTTGATAWAKFGTSLARSGDTLVSGAPDATIDRARDVGAVYVFERDGVSREWSQRARVVPDTTALYGFGATLALDGDTLAVAQPRHRRYGDDYAAGVYVYGRHQGGADAWGATARLSDPFVSLESQFATSVAVSGDLIFVGGSSAGPFWPDYEGVGRVMIFERDRGGPGNWGHVATLSEADVAADWTMQEAFGRALAVHGDHLLVGAPPSDFDTSSNGAAYLFRRDALDGDRWQLLTRLVSDVVLPSQQRLGASVALSSDAALVGAPGGQGGAAYLFEPNADRSAWPQSAVLRPTHGGWGNDFGSSVAVDENALLIGCPGQPIHFVPRQGAAYRFRRSDAQPVDWEPLTLFSASDGQANEVFGSAVALDGATNLVSAPYRRGDAAPSNEHYFGGVYRYDVVETPVVPPPCQPARVPTQTLSDGGSVVAVGALLATASGTLSQPLPVWLVETPPPPEPLDADTVAVGPFYDVGAECPTWAPSQTPFVVGLPLPEGVDPERLRVAVRTPASSLFDAADTQPVWQRVGGSVDVERGLFLVTLGLLDSLGNVLVLVSEQGPAPAITRAPQPAAPLRPFAVSCINVPAGTCGDADEARVAALLQEAAIDLSAQGFRDPALANPVPNLGPRVPGGELEVVFRDAPLYATIFITGTQGAGCVDPNDASRLYPAFYDPSLRSITFCGDDMEQIPEDRLRQYVRHELFHAIQFAYPNVAPGQPRDHWVIEGTATMAMSSVGGSVQRASTYMPLRPADTPLNRAIFPAHTLDYQAQDFWVHLFTSTSPIVALRRTLPLGELATFFERGATTRAVAETLRGGLLRLSSASLGSEYWAWAKNQAFEKTDVTFAHASSEPWEVLHCRCEPQLTSPPLLASTGAPLSEFTFGDGSAGKRGVILGTLESTVVRIHFPEAVSVAISVDGDSALSSKVYLPRPGAGTGDPASCDDVDDCTGLRADNPQYVSVEAGSDVYVLLANTSEKVAPLEYWVQAYDPE